MSSPRPASLRDRVARACARGWSGDPRAEPELIALRTHLDPLVDRQLHAEVVLAQSMWELLTRGDVARTRALLSPVIGRGPSQLEPYTWVRLLNFLGFCHVALGDFVEGIEPLLVARSRALELQRYQEAAMATLNLGEVLRWLGDREAAERQAEDAVALCRRPGTNAVMLGQALAFLTELHLAQGRQVDAERGLTELAALAQETDSPRLRALRDTFRAQQDLDGGRWRAALQRLETMEIHALAGPKEQGTRLGQLAAAHLGLGDLDRAAELADAAAELVRDSGGSTEHVRMARLNARIARAQGDLERALDIMDRALDDQRNHRGESLTLALLGSTQRRIDEVEHVREVELAAVNDALTRTNADLAAARDAAERAAHDRHAFLAAMSHELRTPLTGVLGTLELLGESELVPEQRALVEIVRRSGQLTLAVVDDILDLRKIQEGRLVLVERSFPLLRPARDVVRLLRSSASHHKLVLTLAVDPDLPEHVHGDDRRLEQVLMNLVGNALKFTPSGSVTLRIGQVDDRVRFQVQDTGIGIRREALPTLFEPYVQAHSPEQRVAGTGLGLAISHRLVHALGGELTVSSTLGLGSTFSFDLALPPAEPPPPSRPDTAQLGLSGMRVLLAEDEPVNRLVVSRLLERLGALVETAPDGRDAVRLALDTRPEVVLMDLHMPLMDGPTATRTLRRRGYRGIVLALTASVMEEDRQACIASGMDGFLTKPITQEQLSKVLSSYRLR